MPKKPRGKAVAKTGPPTAPTPEATAAHARRIHLRRELTGIALLLGSVFIAGALLVPGAAAGRSCTSAGGIFGPVGACLRSSVLLTLGVLSAVIVPFIPAVHSPPRSRAVRRSMPRRLTRTPD